MKKNIALFLLLVLTGAAFAGGKKDAQSEGAGESTAKAVEQMEAALSSAPPRNLGQGIRLVVVMPEGRNFTEGDALLLAAVQNRLMDSFKKYSQMTIIDRQNLDTVLEEQERSAGGDGLE
jgi:hypothetical protein